MSFTEGLLIAAVIILIYVLVSSRCEKEKPQTKVSTYECTDKATGDITTVNIKSPITPEQRAINENFEHFSGDALTAAKNAMIGLDGEHSYGSEGFMSPVTDFKDYIAGLAVDGQVLKNHNEFVKDRLDNTNQNITGRTYAFPDDIETDSTPWMGLRRPQAVPTDGNTAQLTDNNPNGYTQTPSFTWQSK